MLFCRTMAKCGMKLERHAAENHRIVAENIGDAHMPRIRYSSALGSIIGLVKLRESCGPREADGVFDDWAVCGVMRQLNKR